MTALSLGLRFVHNLRFHQPGSFGSQFPLLQVVWMMKILGAALGKDFANLPACYTANPMAEGGKRILSDKGNPTRAGGRTRQTRTSRWQRSLAPGLTWNVRFRQHGTRKLQNKSPEQLFMQTLVYSPVALLEPRKKPDTGVEI